jgi:predicted nucleic acid-binding Zn ribbon protein
MKNTAVPIKDVIETLLRQQETQKASTEELLMRNWQWIVSSPAARYASPAVIKNKVLIVSVSNSSWLHQMVLQKHEILARIRECAGEKKITDVRFKIGTTAKNI